MAKVEEEEQNRKKNNIQIIQHKPIKLPNQKSITSLRQINFWREQVEGRYTLSPPAHKHNSKKPN